MKHTAVYWGLFSFIVFGILLSSGYAQMQSFLTLDALRKQELAHAPTTESQDTSVLGVSSDRSGSEVVTQNGVVGLTVLALLQRDYTVIVEYTENGAIVKSVNGMGMEEKDRETGKKWVFTINGKESVSASDRVVVSSSDTIEWQYR